MTLHSIDDRDLYMPEIYIYEMDKPENKVNGNIFYIKDLNNVQCYIDNKWVMFNTFNLWLTD